MILNQSQAAEHHLKTLLKYAPPHHKPRYDGGNEWWVLQGYSGFFPCSYLTAIFAKREYNMAKKGQRKRQPLKKGEYTFVRVNLTKEDKAAASLWCERSADTLDKLCGEVLEAGHKVSFSYNETNDQITCTFTGKPEESVNEYRMLTSFASSWWQALAVNLWKYHEFFPEGVWEDVSDGEDFG